VGTVADKRFAGTHTLDNEWPVIHNAKQKGQQVHRMKSALSANARAHEPLDGAGAADHEVPYGFGRAPRALTPCPFSTRQFVRLLILRSPVRNGLISGDTSQ